MTAPCLRRIIHDANDSSTALFDVNGDQGAARIQTVINKFFHHGGGTLHHFSGGNATRYRLWKNLNFSSYSRKHGIPSTRRLV